MSGVLHGHPVTLPFVTDERLPSEAELNQLREIARRRAPLDEQIAELKAQVKTIDGDLYRLAADLRERYPGRGAMTLMADAINDVLEADKPPDKRSKSRRTMLSRQVGMVNALRDPASPTKRIVLFPEDKS